MATKSQNSATVANVVSKVENQKSAKTQRVLETRDQWSVIFNHSVSLIATCFKGEALTDDCRKGFAFGKVADQPHSRGYAQSLLAGFVSRKANKFFCQTDGLKTIEEREKIALAILVKTRLGGSDEASAKRLLGKAEPKQAKSLAEQVLIALGSSLPVVAPKEQKAEAEVVPTEQKAKSKKSSSASQKKSAKSSKKASK